MLNLSTLSLIVSVVIGLGAAAAVIGGNYRVGRINRYRQEAELWEQRANRFEREAEELRAQNAKQADQISKLQGQVGTLESVVTNKGAIEALTSEFVSWAMRVDTRGAEVLQQIGTMRAEIRENHERLQRLSGG